MSRQEIVLRRQEPHMRNHQNNISKESKFEHVLCLSKSNKVTPSGIQPADLQCPQSCSCSKLQIPGREKTLGVKQRISFKQEELSLCSSLSAVFINWHKHNTFLDVTLTVRSHPFTRQQTGCVSVLTMVCFPRTIPSSPKCGS